MAGVDDGEVRGPLGVTNDDDDPDGFVKVTAVLPDFDVTKKMTLKGMKAVPGNGSVVDVEYKDQSLLMNASVKDKKKKKVIKYRFKVRKLPDRIVPYDCYTVYKKEQVIMYLKKEDNRSWVRDLSDTGLETDPLE
ncbi:uncharacterized protein LOC135488145 [Lineus longissimus]|uniref:uncharacterized protein LOC135488145 n=1 Tax=Lineus longissimus TaxID=88925 RepID=UPI002B4D1EE1